MSLRIQVSALTTATKILPLYKEEYLKTYINNTLKTLPEVTEIASGKYEMKFPNEACDYAVIGNKDLLYFLEKYNGKNIKIYVEEIK